MVALRTGYELVSAMMNKTGVTTFFVVYCALHLPRMEMFLLL